MLYLLSGDNTIAEILNKKQLYLSFITELELLGYGGISHDELIQVKAFLKECNVINITAQIKEKTIKLRRTYRLKLPDSIIAATSQHLGIPLVTADKDFKKLEGISTVIYEH